MQKALTIFFSLIVSVGLFSQPNMQRDSSIVVRANGSVLKFPWAGGLNFVNYGQIDLNNDGFKDLIVFDKSGSKVRTFINDKVSGQASYTHNSIYEDKFPFINSWFATYDYNCDGKDDIFTYNVPGAGGGIRPYRNAGNLNFVQMKDYLLSDYGSAGISNIPDNGIGVPGLTDIDGDGDMDVIVFDVMAYNIEYHQNQSKELYGNCDSLTFLMFDKCWGKFNEGLCQVTLNQPNCPSHKPYPMDTVAQVMHAGSGLMCFDADGDGLTDLLEGDLSCDSVFYLSNKGTVTDAHITSFTTLYPPSHPIAMSIFPSTYFIDVNNDAKRDLIAATNTQGSEDVNNQWLYINAGADNSPNFNFSKNNFLQENMIDLGEGAYPTYFDFEGDGDLDLLVGNFGYYTPSGPTSKIAFYKNTGTATAPSYSLITNDFANLSSIAIPNMAPTTGDLDGDGDPDLLIGVNNGQFYYFTNTAGAGNPAVFSSTPSASFGVGFLTGIRAGTNKSFPQLVDMDQDGKLDIISGAGNGKIYYFRNTGTTSAPTFSLVTNNLGGINVLQSTCSSLGNSMPFVFSFSGVRKMLVGTDCGNMFLYDVPTPSNLSSNFNLINSNAFGINVGAHTAPVLFDVNGDTRLDMTLGNYSGGLTFFKGLNTPYNSIKEKSISAEINVFPNPATDVISVIFNSQNVDQKKIVVSDLSGRKVKEFVCMSIAAEISVSDLSNGIYLLSVQFMNSNDGLKNTTVKKIIVAHE